MQNALEVKTLRHAQENLPKTLVHKEQTLSESVGFTAFRRLPQNLCARRETNAAVLWLN